MGARNVAARRSEAPALVSFAVVGMACSSGRSTVQIICDSIVGCDADHHHHHHHHHRRGGSRHIFCRIKFKLSGLHEWHVRNQYPLGTVIMGVDQMVVLA
mmetsp:Transcript_29092/g.46733  ORF Transcript_29092/g.46733 Transcript_29092/m.46733 type:complete len:100 (-) Transcript_29092:562-861(-)